MVDSGSNIHCTPDLDNLQHFKPWAHPGQVELADGSVVTATGSGTMQYFTPGEAEPVLTLRDVWYVPEMTSSIVSVSALALDMDVLFRSKECLIIERETYRPVLTIPCVNGLYYLHLVTSSNPDTASAPVQFFYKGAPFQGIASNAATGPQWLIDDLNIHVDLPVPVVKSTRVGPELQGRIVCGNPFSPLYDLPDDFQQQQPNQQHAHQQKHAHHHVRAQRQAKVHVTKRRKEVTPGVTEKKDRDCAQDVLKPPAAAACDTATQTAPPIPHMEHLWHRRMGHISRTGFERILKSDAVTGLPHLVTEDMYPAPCYECLAGRHIALPHHPSENPPTIPLQRIHVDITGPHVASVTHTPYSLNAVDYYTNYGIVTQIKTRQHMVSYIKDIINKYNFLGKSQNFRVQEVRFDNPGEFSSRELEDYFRDNGIKISWTTPHEHEQAGKIEVYNRIIGEIYRSLLAEAGTPISFWPYATQTAAYLYNRRVPKSLSKTPYEALTGNKPDISHLHVWGIKVFVKINQEVRKNKEVPVTQEGRFVQYTDSSTIYCIMMSNGIVERCTDVIFAETSNPVAHIPDVHASTPSLPPAKRQKHAHPIPMTAASEREPRILKNPAPVSYKSYAVQGSLNPYPKTPMPTTKDNPPTPFTYQQAISGPHAYHWHTAIQSEINSMIDRNVFTVEELPVGRKALNFKWTFVWKSEHGEITRAKARIVAKGFMQQENIDYNEVFAPTGSQDGLRLLFSTAACEGLILDSIDIKTAFLYGDLSEELYMRQPEGCTSSGNPKFVWRLHKAIYGLKQASRVWYLKLKKVLLELDFHVAPCDPATFYRYEEDGHRSHLFVHVDDIIIAALLQVVIDQIKAEIKSKLDITDCGKLHTFVGVEVLREKNNSVFIYQKAYVESILSSYHTHTTPKITPFPPGLHLRAIEKGKHDPLSADPADTPCHDPSQYRSMVGSLAYVSNQTRPDISYAVNTLSRYFNNPSQEHWDAAQYILSYLLGTVDYGILYSPGHRNTLQAFTDSDFASDTDTHRSISGYCFIQNKGTIAWKSHLQPTIALSTTEAEYMAANMAGREALWLVQARNIYGRNPTECIGIDSSEPEDYATKKQELFSAPHPEPPVISCDNQGAIHLMENNHVKKSNKHINIIYHWSREQIEMNLLRFQYIPTLENPADIFTKSLPGPAFRKFRDMLGIVDRKTLSLP
jgi:hypothetical protein